MEKTLILKAEIREHMGTKATAKVRAQGRIPVIVYGHKEKPMAISVDAHDFIEVLHHGQRLFDIQVDKRPEKIIIKDLQYDYLGKNIIHADLMRVDVTESVKINVPIELKGTAKGTNEGGIIEEHVDRIEVECKVAEIPEAIVVSVKEVSVGDSIHAGEIELPAGVKLVSDPSILLVTCHLVAAAKSTEEMEEEMPVAPEIIGEEKEAEEKASGEESK